MHGRSFATVIACLGTTAALASHQPPAAQPPTFRAEATIVPLDVRVVDASGRPIDDLRREDFTIVEDGVPQRIVQFALQVLTRGTPATGAGGTELRPAAGGEVKTQDRRVFLLVLGRGRQVGPVNGVESAIRFLKERLLPQDRVAVLAYNRATAFTTDHGKLVETLERYRTKHERIESRLVHHFSGLTAAYGSGEIPAAIQQEIDRVFDAPGALASRQVDGPAPTDAAQRAEDTRRDRDKIQRGEIAADRIAAGWGTVFDQSAVDEAALLSDTGFDEYVAKSHSSATDVENLYAGIRYLRWIEGEKHLILLTPGGLFLPRLESSSSIAAFANDARVAVDIIHTGGVPDAPTLPLRTGPASRRGTPPPMPGGGFVQRFQDANSSHIAQLTGGQMTAYRSGHDFFTRLDQSTRTQYLLGYSPSNAAWDGKYRRIEVKVNRKGARVLYRHGYIARLSTPPADRQQFMMYSRIAGAANLARPITDVKLSLSNGDVEHAGGRPVLTATLQILPGTVHLTRTGDLYVGKVELVAFAGDRGEKMIGELWQTLDFNLPQASYDRVAREGASMTLRMPLNGTPRFLKVILYDYSTDRIGTSVLDLARD